MATKHKRKAAPKIVVTRRKARKPVVKPNAQVPAAMMSSSPTMPNGGVPPSFPHNNQN